MMNRVDLQAKKIVSTCCGLYKNLHINSLVRAFQSQHSGSSRTCREAEFSAEVLIPCYNHGRFLETALSSLPEDVAVTVINDASTDDSLSLAKSLQERFKFKLLNNESNLNQAGSLNRAIQESANNLFVVLNADDFLLKFAIRTVKDVFQNHPAVRMVGGGCLVFSNETMLRFNDSLPDCLPYLPSVRIYGPDQAARYQALNDINMTMSGCAFLRSAWTDVGGFRAFGDRVCSFDDRDFQMRVSALTDVAVIEEPLCFYRTDSSTGRAEYV